MKHNFLQQEFVKKERVVMSIMGRRVASPALISDSWKEGGIEARGAMVARVWFCSLRRLQASAAPLERKQLQQHQASARSKYEAP